MRTGNVSTHEFPISVNSTKYVPAQTLESAPVVLRISIFGSSDQLKAKFPDPLKAKAVI